MEGVQGICLDITEHKEMELKLKESEERLKKAGQVAQMGFLDWNLNTDDIMLSDEIIRLYGLGAEKIDTTSKLVEMTILPEDKEFIQHNLDLAINGSKKYNIDHRVKCTDGKIIWVHAQAELTYDADGNPDFLLGTIVDITERKNVENNLKENERILNEAQSIAHIGHFYLNTITLEVSGSDELFKIFGLTTDDNNLDAFAGVVHPDDRECDLYHIQRGMTHGERLDIEHRLLLKDGTEKWFHAIGQSLKDETENINYLIGTVQDITELKKTMLKLKESEEMYSSFVKHYGGIAYRGGLDQVPIFFHGAVEEITGYTEKEFIEGRLPWFSLSHPDDLPSEELMYKMLNIPGYSAQRKYRIYRKDGQIRWIFESGHNVCDKDGKVIAVQGTLNDITNLRRAEEALRESENIMRSILANSPDYILMIDNNYNIQFNNRHLSEKMKDGIINQKRVKDGVAQIFSERKAENTTVSLPTETGTQSYYEVRFGFIKSDGEIIATLLILTDKTERKNLEIELSYSNNLFKNIFSTTSTQFAYLDKNFNFLMVNEAFAKSTGHDVDFFKGKNYFDLYPNAETEEIFQQVVNTGESFFTKARPFKNPERPEQGKTYWDWTLEPLADSYDVIQKLLLTLYDVTERKKLGLDIKRYTNDLEKNVIEKENLFRELHHRVKNNLQIISAITIMQKQNLDQKTREIFIEFQNRIGAMAKLHEILYNSGDFSNLNIQDYVYSLVNDIFLSYNLDKERINFEINTGEIEIDLRNAMYYGLIINELVSNALKYAFPNNKSGLITISMEKPDVRSVILKVEDNGIGISDDIDYTNTETMGLKIVQILTKQLNGSITLNKDKGTGWTISAEE